MTVDTSSQNKHHLHLSQGGSEDLIKGQMCRYLVINPFLPETFLQELYPKILNINRVWLWLCLKFPRLWSQYSCAPEEALLLHCQGCLSGNRWQTLVRCSCTREWELFRNPWVWGSYLKGPRAYGFPKQRSPMYSRWSLQTYASSMQGNKDNGNYSWELHCPCSVCLHAYFIVAHLSIFFSFKLDKLGTMWNSLCLMSLSFWTQDYY